MKKETELEEALRISKKELQRLKVKVWVYVIVWFVVMFDQNMCVYVGICLPLEYENQFNMNIIGCSPVYKYLKNKLF